MSDVELRRCPFCGSEDTDCNGHSVSCNDCHANGPDEPLPDRDWVIQRWNRRPEEDRLRDKLAQRDAEHEAEQFCQKMKEANNE